MSDQAKDVVMKKLEKSQKEKSQDKLEKLCQVLRQETLVPAHEERERLLKEAQQEAKKIIEAAEKEAEQRAAAARTLIEREREVFQTSLKQGCRQALEALRQEIEKKLFNEELERLIVARTKDPNIIAALLNAMVKVIEREGLSADFSALIPATISPQVINALLVTDVLSKLRQGSVEVGAFAGGVQIKLVDSKMTIDLSSNALKELLAPYLRKDFRELLFGLVP
jgi:V/A-type H+-transporting ATPase subunit E